MAGMSIIFASALAFADKKLKVKENPMITKVNKLLPQANCGACGYVSCHDFAEHIVKEGEDPAKCRVLGEEAREELYKLLGKEEGEVFPVVPLICCAAETEHKKRNAEYKGVQTCSAAGIVFDGGMECQYGCMGLGDCVDACPFGALRMEKGLPRVNLEKCTGCGKCAEACPKGIIKMQEKRFDKLVYVACSSHDDILRTKEVCAVGCIACGICEKLSPEGFFKVSNNLSEADYKKQNKKEEIEKIIPKCPTRVIKET